MSAPDEMADAARLRRYWHANLWVLTGLLTIWFGASFGLGILFVDRLNQVSFFGFRLGFWFAQQGGIYVFLLLIIAYVLIMNRLDRRFGVDEGVDEGIEGVEGIEGSAQDSAGQGVAAAARSGAGVAGDESVAPRPAGAQRPDETRS